MTKWVVYYGDGSTFSDQDGSPEDAPSLNVQAITCEPDGVWKGGDIFGLFDYLSRPGWKRVLFGRIVTNIEYDSAVMLARNDPYFDPHNRYVTERVDFYWWEGDA
jgi:hypothetical protein